MPLKRVFDKNFLGGGGNIGSTYAKGGSGIAYRVSTRGEGGSKKAEKLRTYYVHVPKVVSEFDRRWRYCPTYLCAVVFRSICKWI